MNYIRHLTLFYDKIIGDNRLNQSHISLYMALFQLWNQNRFRNPFLISRSEVLLLSKIGSLNTYHKCLRDLSDYKYIGYEPSHNPTMGSKVYLYNFDTTDHTSNDTTSVQQMRQSHRKNDTTNDTDSDPILYKHSKPINKLFLKDNEKKEQEIIIPDLEEILFFFSNNKYPEKEARKFYTYFKAKGWKIGDNTPIVDWNAAAENWMINSAEKTLSRSVNLKKEKNYDEPL